MWTTALVNQTSTRVSFPLSLVIPFNYLHLYLLIIGFFPFDISSSYSLLCLLFWFFVSLYFSPLHSSIFFSLLFMTHELTLLLFISTCITFLFHLCFPVLNSLFSSIICQCHFFSSISSLTHMASELFLHHY